MISPNARVTAMDNSQDSTTESGSLHPLVIRETKERCHKCGGKMMSSQVAVWCQNVKFALGTIAPDSPCDNALMSG